MVNERVVERVVPHGGVNDRRILLSSAALTALWLLWASTLAAQEIDRAKLYEPIFRVSKKALATSDSNLSSDAAIPTDPAARGLDSHPLDPALAMARNSLDHIERNVLDYTCTLVKRERVHGELLEHEFMTCKIRHARMNEAAAVSFGVYLSFLKPDGVRGREVIYVDGLNDGKMVAHEGGLKGRFLPTVSLLPTSALAMRGNRYPITEIGILTLTRRLIEKGERDRKFGECQVRLVDGAKVRDRVCTMLEVKHHEQRPQYDFHLARVFLDRELNLPIRYEAYGWPAQPGDAPPLLEEYTYMDVRVNVGLTDSDFDTKNAKYRF
jgi:hypothetical protein